jgi:hypothetical protein
MTDLLEAEVEQQEQAAPEAEQSENLPELPPAMQPGELAAKLRLETSAVRLQRGKWGVTKKLDKNQVEKAAEAFEADAKFLGASKKLINSRNKKYTACTKILARAVAHWKIVTIPYPDKGIRLIRRDRIEAFNEKLAEFETELAAAAIELDRAYQEIKDDAQEKLGELFRASDYPTGGVADLFKLEWDFPSIEPDAYLKQLSPKLYEQEQARIQSRFEEAVRLTEAAFAEQFQKLVSHLAESLQVGEDGKVKKFHASNVENLREFFERFRALNVGSNAELEHLIGQAQEIVGGVDATKLSKDVTERQSIQTAMSELAGKIDTLLVNKPLRAIDLSDED